MALCSPSRTSLLTGLRPDATGVFDLVTHFRQNVPGAVTLPQLFRQNGSHSAALYKVFHLIPTDPQAFGNMDDTLSWSRPLWLPTRSVYGPAGEAIRQKKFEELRLTNKPMDYQSIPRGFALEAPTVADGELADGETARQAVSTLQELKDKPFFLAVGFYKPHLPFVAPKKYWGMYDSARVQLPGNRYAPRDAPPYAVKRYAELLNYEDFKALSRARSPSMAQQRQLVHGYLACISYVDAQIGLLLDELDRLRLREKTIVVLIGDHGYQVGEHDMWANKHTNYETSTHAPLIVSVPGQPTAGQHTDALVEFVDVYPSLAELCGLPVPRPRTLTGKSFVPLLKKPDQPWKTAALSQYPITITGQGPGMGRSMRTDRYRFVEWQVPTQNFRQYELYDHKTDPDENVNLAGNPANNATVKTLTQQLNNEWKKVSTTH